MLLTPDSNFRATIQFNPPKADTILNTLPIAARGLLQKIVRKTLPHNWLVIDYSLAKEFEVSISTFTKAITQYKKLNLLTPLSDLYPMSQQRKVKLIQLHEEVLGTKWTSSTKVYQVNLNFIWTGGIDGNLTTLGELTGRNNPLSYEACLNSIKAMTEASLLFPNLT